MPRTFRPTASTTPAASDPMPDGNGWGYRPVRRYTSAKFTPSTVWRTSASWAAGAPTSTSSHLSTSGPPRSLRRIALAMHAPVELPGGRAAVDAKIGARDPARLIRRQVGREPCDILRLAQALDHELRQDGVVVARLFELGPGRSSDDHGRRDAVGADVMRTSLAGQLSRHRQHPALAGAVCQCAGNRMRDMGVGRGKIHDRTAATLLEVRPRRFAAQKHHVEFAVECTFPIALEVHLLDEFEGAEGPGVDQHIDAAMAFGSQRHQPLDIGRLGQIAGMNTIDGKLFPTGLIDRHLRRGGVDVATHDARPMARKHQRAALADTTAGAGDDRNFALKALR